MKFSLTCALALLVTAACNETTPNDGQARSGPVAVASPAAPPAPPATPAMPATPATPPVPAVPKDPRASPLETMLRSFFQTYPNDPDQALKAHAVPKLQRSHGKCPKGAVGHDCDTASCGMTKEVLLQLKETRAFFDTNSNPSVGARFGDRDVFDVAASVVEEKGTWKITGFFCPN